MNIEKNSILDVIDTNGLEQQVEVIFLFESGEKQYVVYTKDEMREHDLVVLYASSVKVEDGRIIFENISDDEWLLVKEKMREVMHKEGGNP